MLSFYFSSTMYCSLQSIQRTLIVLVARKLLPQHGQIYFLVDCFGYLGLIVGATATPIPSTPSVPPLPSFPNKSKIKPSLLMSSGFSIPCYFKTSTNPSLGVVTLQPIPSALVIINPRFSASTLKFLLWYLPYCDVSDMPFN